MEHREWEEREALGRIDALEEDILGQGLGESAYRSAWEDFAASGKIQDYLRYREEERCRTFFM